MERLGAVMDNLFSRLSNKQVRHLQVVVDREPQDWLDGRVMVALERRKLVRRNVLSGDWIVTWGVDEAWLEWQAARTCQHAASASGKDVSGNVWCYECRPVRLVTAKESTDE